MPKTDAPVDANRRPAEKGPSEVAPGIFVGGWHDAAAFVGERFCVLDEKPDESMHSTHIPIYNEADDRADPMRLEQLANAVAGAHAAGRRVLIFCGHGVRRSPLAAAWYLHRSQGLSLDAAYERIRAVRPKVEPARSWLGNARELEQG
jgi:hypothetical protein